MTYTALPELKESEARGRIAEIYDDIRHPLRVPMVNLIFRHMATIDDCLEWAWANVGPVYLSGRLGDAAEKLRSDLRVQPLALAPAEARACGLDEAGLQSVIATCDAYARANIANLLSLKALAFILDETKMGYARRKPMRGVLGRAAVSSLPTLPPMADLGAVPPETKTLLRNLAIQVHGADGPVIPSFYRHFAAWPAFLALLHGRLAPIMPEVADSAGALERASHMDARLIYLDCPAVRMDAPSPETVETLRRLIERFPPNICKMSLIALAMAGALTPAP